MVDYIELLRGDLAEQFKDKPVIDALIEAIGIQLNDVRQFYEDLRNQRNIADAVGKQLDGIGDIAVLSRGEAGVLACLSQSIFVLTDDIYRSYLYYKIWKNTNNCTYRDIIKSLRMFWDLPIYYSEDPEQPATMILDTGEMEGTVDTRPLFTAPLLRAAGVTLKLFARTTTTLDAAIVIIRSGPDITNAVSTLPILERDYNYKSRIRLQSGFVTHSKDTLPEVERNYVLNNRMRLGSGFVTRSKDMLPEVERNYVLNSRIRLGSGFVTHSKDALPELERGYSYASQINVGGSVYSIMQTVIGDYPS